MELFLSSVRRLIHGVSLIYFCVLSLAVNVGLFPPRAASSALSAAPAHSWVRPHVHTHTIHTAWAQPCTPRQVAQSKCPCLFQKDTVVIFPFTAHEYKQKMHFLGPIIKLHTYSRCVHRQCAYTLPVTQTDGLLV